LNGELIELKIPIDTMDNVIGLFGKVDENLKMIHSEYKVDVVSRGSEILVIGERDEVTKVQRLITQLLGILKKEDFLTPQHVRYAMDIVKKGENVEIEDIFDEVICITTRGKRIKPKTFGQKAYVKAIKNNDIVFGIGPAGTGKTYLAMAMAVTAFKKKEVNRIILTRPAVEAGEKLGFLPGDLQEKVDPYLRPLYDALYDILGAETFQKFMDRGMIEVAPLAYMRGRTLDDSYIILDEAQNTTPEQMKMFLTRMGFGSKAIITGDITQVDLPKGKFSGLDVVRKILGKIKGIEFIHLTDRDVVRHELVQKIIKAYEEYGDIEEKFSGS
jgi:phosphate starvation-inducible PhoH-like protein